MQNKTNTGTMPNRDDFPVVLWLASWYPCRIDAFNGDFIQRAAMALAQRMPVHVFYLMKDEHGQVTKKHLEDTTRNGQLTETRLYYHPFKSGFPKLDRLISAWHYTILGRQWIKRFRKKQKPGKPWIVEVGVAMRAGTLALWMKKKWGQHYLVQEHWTGYYKYLMPPQLQKGPLFWRLSAKILEQADRLLPDSRHLGEWINSEFVQVAFTEIPNAVDTSLFNYTNPENVSNVFRFIHVSTLGYQKNTDGILRAFLKWVETHPEYGAELEIVGPGFENHLQFVKTHAALDGRVQFSGPLPYREVANHMRKAHALVLFSRYENLPCVMLEAFCCGLPVIATRVGGIAYHFTESNGFLVESENEGQLLEALDNMFNRYKTFNREAISHMATARYGMEAIGYMYEKTYSENYPHLFAKSGYLVG